MKHKKLLQCPFCGCEMGILHIGGGFRWYGDHKSCCILESNGSASYGKIEDLVEAWNTRVKKKDG